MIKLPSLLLINYSPYGGGSTVALYRLAAELADRHYTVGIASPPNSWLEEQVDQKKIALFWLGNSGDRKRHSMTARPIPFFLKALFTSIELRKIILAGRWDIVHVNTLPNISGAIAAKMTKRPWLWHIHEVSFSSPLVLEVLRFSAHMLGKIFVCPSASAVGLFKSKNPLQIPNFISDDWADMPEESTVTIKKRFGIQPEHRVVLWIGGIEPRKGFDKVLDMLTCSDPFKETVFVSAGLTSDKYSEYYSKLKARAEKSPTPVIFISDMQDPRPLYKISDAVLQTSLIPEAFGLTVLEAMAFGKPVICSGLGGTAEFVRHGISAHVLEDSKSETLRRAVLKVLNEPEYAEQIGVGARQTAVKFFSSSIVPRWEDTYKTLASFR